MSHKAMVWAAKQQPETPIAKLVLMMLADVADKKDHSCYPSYQYLADKCVISRRSAMRAIRSLEEGGFLSITARGRGHGQTSNVYFLNVGKAIQSGDTQSLPDGDRESPPSDTQSPPSDRESPPDGDTVSPDTVTSFNQSLNQSLTLTRENQPRRNRKKEFDQWYDEFPKHVGRKPALAKWMKVQDLPPIEVLMTKLREQKKHDRQWAEGFIPNPLTYINQERWNDEIQTGNGTGNQPLSPAEEYEQRSRRAAAILSAIDGGDVGADGEAIPPTVDEEQRGHRRRGFPRLVT